MKLVGSVMVFEPLRIFKYLTFFFPLSLVLGDVKIVKFASDFIQLQGRHVDVCNFVICNEMESTKIFKEVSLTFTCFTRIRSSRNETYNFNTKLRNIFVVENACASSFEFLRRANSSGFFRSKNIWLLFDPFETQPNINHTNSLNQNDFRDFELTISSEFYLAQETFTNRIRLLGFYKRDPDNSLVKEHLNEWSFDKGFNDRVLECFAIRRQNLFGRIFNSAIVLADRKSLDYSDSLIDIHKDSLSRVDHAMILLVTTSLNASSNFIVTSSWGNKVNGSYDGMIGLVVDGKAEIAGTQSFPTKERLEVIEYIDKPIRTEGHYIFMSPPLSFKRNIFTLPFHKYVWFTYVGLVLTTIPLLYFVSRLESKTQKIKIEDSDRCYKLKSKSNSLGDILMLNVAAFCTQGSHTLESRAASGRLTIVTLFVMVIFISTSYTAYITVLLRTTDKSIVSLRDLLESNLELGVYNTTYNKYYYSSAQEPTRKAIAKKVFSYKKRDPFVSIEEGVRRIRTDRYAFDVEHSPGFHMIKAIFTEEEKCRLQVIKQSFLPDIEPMLAIKKDLSYTEILKIKFERLHESGLANRIGVRLYTKKPRCTASTSFHFSIGLTDTHHVFELLILAIFTSWIILTIEIIIHRKNFKKNKPPSFPFAI